MKERSVKRTNEREIARNKTKLETKTKGKENRYSWNRYTKGKHTICYATNKHNRAFTVNRKDATLPIIRQSSSLLS